MINSLVIFDLFAVIFQILAAWFAYRIYKFDRLSGWWIGLIIAFIFQAIRRLFQAYNDWLNLSTNPLFDRVLMFLISLFLVMGLWEMFKKFESFEIVEKNVKNKMNRIKLK
jgi:hypothetical protein